MFITCKARAPGSRWVARSGEPSSGIVSDQKSLPQVTDGKLDPSWSTPLTLESRLLSPDFAPVTGPQLKYKSSKFFLKQQVSIQNNHR
mmetsp:Transcript_8009/g.17087  ORF Transcript_8009/g.17087 Transcript_8009/m.17087 type:complete len:88 (-) Transcript_8009:1613-1876(-)